MKNPVKKSGGLIKKPKPLTDFKTTLMVGMQTNYVDFYEYHDGIPEGVAISGLVADPKLAKKIAQSILEHVAYLEWLKK